MLRTVLTSKIHRARVTDADLNYVGSITIDEKLMNAANLLPNEKVQVVNNNNGARLETYVIPGDFDSGTICLNGAAARHVQKNDIVIIMSYGMMETGEAQNHKPVVVLLDEYNHITNLIYNEQLT